MPRQPARRAAATQARLARHAGYPSLVVSLALGAELIPPNARAVETSRVEVEYASGTELFAMSR